MALSTVVDALIAQHFSCEDGTKDFQAVYIEELFYGGFFVIQN